MNTLKGGLGGDKWNLVIIGALLLVVLVLLGPTARVQMLSNLRTDPIGVLQGWGARLALVLLAAGAVLHFVPWTREVGNKIVEGCLIGLGILFVGVPILGWVLTHLHDIGSFFSGLGVGA